MAPLFIQNVEKNKQLNFIAMTLKGFMAKRNYNTGGVFVPKNHPQFAWWNIRAALCKRFGVREIVWNFDTKCLEIFANGESLSAWENAEKVLESYLQYLIPACNRGEMIDQVHMELLPEPVPFTEAYLACELEDAKSRIFELESELEDYRELAAYNGQHIDFLEEAVGVKSDDIVELQEAVREKDETIAELQEAVRELKLRLVASAVRAAVRMAPQVEPRNEEVTELVFGDFDGVKIDAGESNDVDFAAADAIVV